MTKTDITFTDNGIIVTLFANTEAGEDALNEIGKEFSTFKFDSRMWPSIKLQLKNAGYTVRKARKLKPITGAELDKMFEELKVSA